MTPTHVSLLLILPSCCGGETWTFGSPLRLKPVGKEMEPPSSGRKVPKVPFSEYNITLFRRSFSNKRPFVLKGVVPHWPATGHWLWSTLVNKSGPYNSDNRLQAMIETFTHKVALHGSAVIQDVLSTEPFATDCPYHHMSGQTLNSGGTLGSNFLPTFDNEFAATELTIGHTFFIATPSGSGSALHADPYTEGYWNAQVHGRKRWMLVSEKELQDLTTAIAGTTAKLRGLVARLADGPIPAKGDVAAVRSLLHRVRPMLWFESLLPGLSAAGVDLSSEEVVVEPGEIIYGPGNGTSGARSYHVVLALEDSVGCSEQLVDERNLLSFVRFLVRLYPEHRTRPCALAQKHWPKLTKSLVKACRAAKSEGSTQENPEL